MELKDVSLDIEGWFCQKLFCSRGAMIMSIQRNRLEALLGVEFGEAFMASKSEPTAFLKPKMALQPL